MSLQHLSLMGARDDALFCRRCRQWSAGFIVYGLRHSQTKSIILSGEVLWARRWGLLRKHWKCQSQTEAINSVRNNAVGRKQVYTLLINSSYAVAGARRGTGEQKENSQCDEQFSKRIRYQERWQLSLEADVADYFWLVSLTNHIRCYHAGMFRTAVAPSKVQSHERQACLKLISIKTLRYSELQNLAFNGAASDLMNRGIIVCVFLFLFEVNSKTESNSLIK